MRQFKLLAMVPFAKSFFMLALQSVTMCILFVIFAAFPLPLNAGENGEFEIDQCSQSKSGTCYSNTGPGSGGGGVKSGTEKSIEFNLGLFHGKLGTKSSPQSTTTEVEGGFRTGIYDKQMNIKDTTNSDGSRTIIQETKIRTRTFRGSVESVDIKQYEIPSDPGRRSDFSKVQEGIEIMNDVMKGGQSSGGSRCRSNTSCPKMKVE